MKRCFCGTSKRFPLCDNSHQGMWSCVNNRKARVRDAVLVCEHYLSLGQKWAAHHKMYLLEDQLEDVICERLWILCDGSDIERLLQQRKQIVAQSVSVIGIDIAPQYLSIFGQIDDAQPLQDAGPGSLWVQLNQIFARRDLASPLPRYQSLFLSHAVADERRLEPAIRYFRTYLGFSVFSCSDSIPNGDNWYVRIVEALRSADVVLCMLSKDVIHSTFCAFEMGMARALHKPISMVSLDESLPPAYMQEIQMLSLARHHRTRPWLSAEDVLIEGMLLSLSHSFGRNHDSIGA